MPTVNIEVVGAILRQTADELILPRWQNLKPGDIAQKSGPQDLVTIADHETEAALRDRLTARYPGTTLIGEETFAADPTCLDRLDSDVPVWITDPIDGTRAFTEGRATFAAMLVLVTKRIPRAAWIYQPVTGDLYCGETGGGVARVARDRRQTRLAPIAASKPEDISGIVSGNIWLDGRRIYRREHAQKFARLEPMSCPGIDYPRLLRGEAQFAVFGRCLPWDHLPGLTMMREVGWADEMLDRAPYDGRILEGGILCGPSPAMIATIRERLLAPAI